MENSTLDNDFTTNTELIIDPETRAFLKETSKWAKFLAIVGFIFAGFMVLIGLFFGTIFFAILYIMPMLYMYRFATKIQTALAREDQFELTSAFENLKSLYKFAGIVTIIMLGFYALTFLGSMIFGAMM